MIYERRSRRPGQDSAASKPLVMDCDQHSGLASWKRRQHAACRVAPLDCGCPDPWPCRCSEPPLSDKMIDGGRDAALHLLAAGRIPLIKIEVLQALYRRGRADRELAELLFEATGGEIA
jgi:hypothetical protein